LETGTARGFSALVMAKALHDSKKAGKIITLDILSPNKPIYWNCMHDAEGKKTRFELLNKWHNLVENYIVFIQGFSDIMLKRLALSRIHFAFLDGGHDYNTVRNELSYVKLHQSKDDVIVCDDFTESQFPGLIKAVNEFISTNEYDSKVFKSSADRSYVLLRKK
jgi:predicted O-methyltransferase YrrM